MNYWVDYTSRCLNWYKECNVGEMDQHLLGINHNYDRNKLCGDLHDLD